MTQPPVPPLDLEELADLGRRFAERKMYEEAANLFVLALRLDPKNIGLNLALAQVRRMQKQDKARPGRDPEEALREQMRRSSIDSAQFLGLAHLYAEKGEHGPAIECLEIAKAKQLADPAPYKLQGRILFRRKDYGAAAEQFARALRLNPFDRETAEALSRAEYERRHFRPALEASIDAFLLLPDGDEESAERLKRRIRTVKQMLGCDNQELVALFHERQELLRTAFDRLEYRKELFREGDRRVERTILQTSLPVSRREAGKIGLATRLRQLEVLAHLTDEQIFALTRAVRAEQHERGGVIFKHGSSGADAYVLERGEVTLRRPTSYGTFPIAIYGAGEFFGEANFIARNPRGGDAVATQPAQILRIDAEALDALILESAELGVQLYWSFWHGLAQKLRAVNEHLKTFFASDAQPENFVRLRRAQQSLAGKAQVDPNDKVRLFREQGLSGKELESLAAFSREKHFSSGALIFQEGDAGNEMYVVLEGRVRISKFIPGGGEEALAILERGDFFGEMSLIDGQPRSADARAHGGPVTVLALDEPTVHEVLTMDPHASLEFLRLLCRLGAKRLREMDEKVVGWRIMSGERTSETA